MPPATRICATFLKFASVPSHIARACAGPDFANYASGDARKATWVEQMQDALAGGRKVFLHREDHSCAFAFGL